MKNLAPALVLMLLLSGCSKEDSSTAEAPSLEWVEPKNPDVEFYIATPIQRVTMRPIEGSWDSNVRSVSSFSTDQKSEFPYTVDFEYEGTEAGIDHYMVKITSPQGLGTQTVEKKVLYQGAEIELLRDENCLVGIRQRTGRPKS